MAHDILRLYGQGRAKSSNELWSPEEWEAVVALEQGRGIGRLLAADYVRNGILTLEDYDKAVANEFKPAKLDDVLKEATEGLKHLGAKAVKKHKTK